MKKVMILFFVLLVSFTTSALASPVEKSDNKKWDEKQVNKRLLQLGLTEEQIGYLNWESKVEIAMDKEAKKVLSFSRKGYSFDEETGEISEETGEFSTMALVDDIYLNTVAIDYGQSNGHPYIKVVGDYNWSKMPFYRLQDGFALSWSEGWYAKSWGFTNKQKYCTWTSGGTCYDPYWKSTSHSTPYDQDRLAGVGWRYDLTGNAWDATGTAYVYLEANDESKVKSTNYSAFVSWYGHDKYQSDLGISIGLPKGAGIAATVSFGGEEYVKDSTSIYNPGLTY